MTQYIEVDEITDEVLSGQGSPDPVDFTGPYTIPPEAKPGVYFVLCNEPLNFSANPSPTSTLKWRGALTWIETASLTDLGASAIVEIDRQADAARLTVSPAGRDLEYTLAQAQAQAYKDAAYTGDVPPCVDSWARAKRWSARNSAIDILATAALWYPALEQIRDLRLNAKEAVRRVVDSSASIDAIVTQFQTDLTNLMKGLQ
jgi:hypothetical protein